MTITPILRPRPCARLAAMSVAVLLCLPTSSKAADDLLIDERFESGMDRWWVEGGERVWVEDGKLRVDADPPGGDRPRAATVWHRRPIEGDVQVSYDAHVITSEPDVNNINFFLLYSDPSGTPLDETADDRAEAEYPKYHELSGYIFTFVNEVEKPERPARIRIRRCPGFELLSEAYAYHCRQGRTYHFEITRSGNELQFRVDGQLLLTAHDEQPHQKGLIGLRTFRTDLWWDNVQVRQLRATPSAGNRE